MTKHGLRGFAGGLIIATLVLSYVYYFHTDKPDANAELTDSDIENYARQHNLVLLTEKEYQDLNDERHTEAEKQNEKKEQPKQEKEESKQEKVIQVIFDVSPGMSTGDVGQKLQDVKLIANKSDFTNYIKKHDLESSIKAGSYELNSEMTIKEIAEVLTK